MLLLSTFYRLTLRGPGHFNDFFVSRNLSPFLKKNTSHVIFQSKWIGVKMRKKLALSLGCVLPPGWPEGLKGLRKCPHLHTRAAEWNLDYHPALIFFPILCVEVFLHFLLYNLKFIFNHLDPWSIFRGWRSFLMQILEAAKCSAC